MRLFVAVYPSDDAAEDLAAAVARLHVSTAQVNTRLARRETWHVTLAFLGDVPDERGHDAGAAVASALGGAEPPTLRVAGGGRFGRGRFTVLWAGVEGDLDDLARRVRGGLKRGRFPYDRKPLKPHVTIARPGDRLDRELIDADRAALDGYRGPAWTVRSVDLMRSRPGPRPTYELIARTSFDGC
nr:RNA 2',3'-cyclic phosphodiesterase [uncultured Actinoplanes sp.]